MTVLLSSLPAWGGAVEVGVLELPPDLVQQVPARGAMSNVVAGRAAFVISRVELANDASFSVRRVPDEGARVVDAELFSFGEFKSFKRSR